MDEFSKFFVSPLFWLCAVLMAIILNAIFFLAFKRSESEKYLRLLGTLSTFFLVLVGLWYTWETRGLRKQAEDQLFVMRKQFQISNAPSLIPSVVTRDQVKQLAMEGKIKQKTGKTLTKEQLAEAIKYGVLANNIGQRTAFNIRLYMFNNSTKSFMKSILSQAYLAPEKTIIMTFFDEKLYYVDEIKIIEEVNNEYDLKLDSLNSYLNKREQNLLLLFYKDSQENVYLCTRQFAYTANNNLFHLATEYYNID